MTETLSKDSQTQSLSNSKPDKQPAYDKGLLERFHNACLTIESLVDLSLSRALFQGASQTEGNISPKEQVGSVLAALEVLAEVQALLQNN